MEELMSVPADYMYCFNVGCPRERECMRHFAGEHIDPKVKQGSAVFPTALQEGTVCQKFKQKRVIKAAWGFDHLFADVKARHTTLLRNKLKDYLGGNGTYYRYHHGERLLTPEEQEWILNLFHQYGYTEDLHFDGYRDVWDW